MLVCVSPAKALDFSPLERSVDVQAPRFLAQSEVLGGVAKKCTRSDFKSLMKLSDALSDLTYQRFQSFAPRANDRERKAAVFAFNGDTYRGLDAASMSDEAVDYAQDHLRILSGLYGVLRPLDEIEPYRLEMGIRLANPEGKDLYAFWRETVTASLSAELENQTHAVLVNCASVEYFKAVDPKALAGRIVTPVFKEERGGVAKIVSFHAKRARGMMARFIIDHKVSTAEGITAFNEDGYIYRPKLSEPDQPVFTRLVEA
ncbi:MAG: peroxide stress protein YaaA [Rhodobiaceae bacterium]|nr:peroxide stress protein YaaA [Rhodobiaceae bacterium]